MLQQLAVPAPARQEEASLPQGVVAKVLFSLPKLVEKEFDVWLTLVDDALLGAGMEALSRVSAVKTDALADHQDVQTVRAYPTWQTNTAWTALRRAIGPDSTAFSRTLALRTGDVLALLRALRSFYERRSVSVQTQLRKDLMKLSLAEFPDWKNMLRPSTRFLQS